MLQMYILNISAVSNVCYKGFIWMLHMLQWLYTYVATICFKCFTYFRRMLHQVLHVASVFISRSSMFHAFQTYISYVSSEYRMCFIGCCKSRSDVTNVNIVPTYMHVHWRVAQKRSEGRSSMQGHGREWSPPACASVQNRTK